MAKGKRQEKQMEKQIKRDEKRINATSNWMALRNKRRIQRANGAKYPWQR